MENPFIYMAKQEPANRIEKVTGVFLQLLFILTILSFIVGGVAESEIGVFAAFGMFFLQAVIQGWYPKSMRAQGLYNDSDDAHRQNSASNAWLYKAVVIICSLCALAVWFFE